VWELLQEKVHQICITDLDELISDWEQSWPSCITSLRKTFVSGVVDSSRSVMRVLLFLWPAMRYGSGYQTVWEIRPSAETPSSVYWRRFYFQLTRVHSALELFERCTLQITYLLTYLLCIHFRAIFFTCCYQLDSNQVNLGPQLRWNKSGVSFYNDPMVARARRALQVSQGSVETLFRWNGKYLYRVAADLFATSFGRQLSQVTVCTIFSLLKPSPTVLISFVRGNIHTCFPLFNIRSLKTLISIFVYLNMYNPL